jgi:hypothetical protein
MIVFIEYKEEKNDWTSRFNMTYISSSQSIKYTKSLIRDMRTEHKRLIECMNIFLYK